MNSAGPGRPEISMYFFVRPKALSATQLYPSKLHITQIIQRASNIGQYASNLVDKKSDTENETKKMYKNTEISQLFELFNNVIPAL